MRPHQIQRAVWIDNIRFKMILAGRRSGKTELSKRKLILASFNKMPWDDPRYVYAAPTHNQARRIAWEDLKALMPDDILADTPNESTATIKTIFGSTITVMGLDKPQRLEGPPLDGIILDESCDMKPGTFDRSVYPALADRNGWAWRIGVPKRGGSSSLEVKEAYNRAVNCELEDWAAYTWPSSDILPAKVIEYAKATLDRKTYREQFEASWEKIGGAVYWAFEQAYNVRPCVYDPRHTLYVCSDFNVDPLCWCFAQKINGVIQVIDELVLRDANTQLALAETWERYFQHQGGFEFYGDATGNSRKTSASTTDYVQILADSRFKRAGRTVHYPKSNPPVVDRYAVTNSALCSADGTRRLFIDPKCKMLIDDLEQVVYAPGTRVAKETGDRTHMSDALGYMLMYKVSLNATEETAVGQFST